MSIYTTVNAVIKPGETNQRFAYLVDSQNPETIVSEMLRIFMEEIGYSDIFPNFDNIRIGNVHPFAILLSQIVFEQPQSTNMFPSITVADSSTDESEEVLSDDYEVLVFNPEDIATLDGYRLEKRMFASDPGWAKVHEAVAERGYVIGVKRIYRTTHSIDINIWTENKEVTSFIFDMVCHFVTQKRLDLHEPQYGLDLGSISGRRSGDVNLDFGVLLYGGNVSVRASMLHSAVLFDTDITTISAIDTRTLPQYFAQEVS